MDFKTEPKKHFGQVNLETIITKEIKSDEYLASSLNFFSKAFHHLGRPGSLIEFGANVGVNLKAIKLLYPGIDLFGIEINKNAARELANLIENHNVYNGSIFDFETSRQYDVSLIRGVLIHTNPRNASTCL